MAKFIIYSLPYMISYAQIFEVDKPEEAVIKAKEIAKSIAKIIDFDYDKIEVANGDLGFQFKQHGEFSISMRDTIGDMTLMFQVVPGPMITYWRISDTIKSGNFVRDEVAADIANLNSYADKVWNRLIDNFHLMRDELYSTANSDRLEIALDLGYETARGFSMDIDRPF